ncbi:hypothetical protein [Gimesia fumaroli]|uniref:Uncharacterized protein n=1 Tax=Gimesia fumaroli TaxID=2527976 RepID=A0A518IFK3_9PLAN|nr:hypothetical protein [Gimesia fumaroli]QDV51850.1 hypothetical protein Enr17x_39090 [Gimesia fumaroli]
MRSHRRSTLLSFAVMSLLCITATSTGYAIMGIKPVSQKLAKELGIEVRAKANGAEQVWVTLEFKPAGEIKQFDHVSLEIGDGKEFLVGYAPLQARRTKSGTVVCGFLANRAYLEKVTLRIVVGPPLNKTGYDLQLKKFLDLKKSP